MTGKNLMEGALEADKADYRHSATGKLLQVVLHAENVGGAETAVSYQYDAFGRPVITQAATDVEKYLWGRGLAREKLAGAQ